MQSIPETAIPVCSGSRPRLEARFNASGSVRNTRSFLHSTRGRRHFQCVSVLADLPPLEEALSICRGRIRKPKPTLGHCTPDAMRASLAEPPGGSLFPRTRKWKKTWRTGGLVQTPFWPSNADGGLAEDSIDDETKSQ
jgi:hypothetical protein